MSMARKMRRMAERKGLKTAEVLTEAECLAIVEQIKAECIEQTIIKLLAISGDILARDYGKLKPKATRLETFVKLFIQEVELCETPTVGQVDYEKKLRDMGITIKMEGGADKWTLTQSTQNGE